MSEMSTKRVYCSPKEAAAILGTSYHTILRNLDDFPHRRFGQKIFILYSAIDPENCTATADQKGAGS